MSDDQWVWRCDRVIPSNTADGRRVLEEILQQLELLDWVSHDVFSVHLAVEEALVNAIAHGNKFDPRKQVEFSCRISAELVRIEITDQGDGFDGTALPDPTDADHLGAPAGRGVLLMKSFMSRVKYQASGNRVVLEKDRCPAE